MHRVSDAETKKVHEVSAIQRRPLEERWGRAAVEQVSVFPSLLQPAGALEEAEVIPKDRDVDEVPEEVTRGPSRLHISSEDLARFGFSANCPKCAKLRGGHSGRGYRHHEACRLRIETRLREEEDPRMAKTDARITKAIVDLGDPSVVAPAAARTGGEEGSK